MSRRAVPTLYRPDSTVPTLRKPRYSQSLEFGLAILRCFSPQHPVLGIFDIADQLGMGRSTTHRYVITLVALGYLEQGASRKYRLGIRPTDLGIASLNSAYIRDPARPHLEKLHRSTRYSVGLGVLDRTHVVYIDHLCSQRYSQEPDGPKVRAGVRVPACCTSIGKLLLAFLPQDERESVLAENDHARRTKHVITKKRLRE